MSFTTVPTMSVAILAGGKSQRMGTDKALLRIGGQEILDRTIAVACDVASTVVVVGDRPAYHGRGVPVIADAYPGAAAIGGIVTAIEHLQCSHVMILACDMPYLSRAVLSDMSRFPGGYDALVPVTGAESCTGASVTLHPLHAIYSRSCLGAFRQAMAARDLSIVRALNKLCVATLTESWIRERDASLLTLTNVNRPSDLEAV